MFSFDKTPKWEDTSHLMNACHDLYYMTALLHLVKFIMSIMTTICHHRHEPTYCGLDDNILRAVLYLYTRVFYLNSYWSFLARSSKCSSNHILDTLGVETHTSRLYCGQTNISVCFMQAAIQVLDIDTLAILTLVSLFANIFKTSEDNKYRLLFPVLLIICDGTCNVIFMLK